MIITIVGIFVSRQNAFYYQVCFAFAMFVRFVMTMIFRSPRPFMELDHVWPPICLINYGSPDCAIFELCTMVVVIMKNPKSTVFTTRGSIMQSRDTRATLEAIQHEQSMMHTLLRYGTYVMWAGVYCIIVLANFVSGNSSVDQLFFGTTLGIWTGFFCSAIIRKPLDRHITRLLNGEYELTGYSGILKVLLVIVSLDFLFITAFALIMSFTTTHKPWLKQIEKVCTYDQELNYLTFEKYEYAISCV